MALAYRVPDNMIGHTLRNATMVTQGMNKHTIDDKEKTSYENKYMKGHRNSILSTTTKNNFPMTTN